MTQIQPIDFSVNTLKAILWQYDGAPNLRALIDEQQSLVEECHTVFWQDWYKDVFNLRTANDFGLAVWAIILNINLGVSPIPFTGDQLGFIDFAIDGRQNFNRGNFGPSEESETILNKTQKRIALQLRFYQLWGRGTVPQINHVMAYIFSMFGPVYVVDNLDMSINYVFGFAVSEDLRYIFDNFDLLPRPAGVEATWTDLGGNQDFGYGSFRKNFNRGNFEI